MTPPYKRKRSPLAALVSQSFIFLTWFIHCFLPFKPASSALPYLQLLLLIHGDFNPPCCAHRPRPGFHKGHKARCCIQTHPYYVSSKFWCQLCRCECCYLPSVPVSGHLVLCCPACVSLRTSHYMFPAFQFI